MSGRPQLSGSANPRPPGMPPMPPGFKMPAGAGMPPMPPGFKTQPPTTAGAAPLPPHLRGNAPPPISPNININQHQQYHQQHQQYHQPQQQNPIPSGYPSHNHNNNNNNNNHHNNNRYPQPPYFSSRPEEGRGYMPTTTTSSSSSGILSNPGDMYAARDNRQAMMMPPQHQHQHQEGVDPRGYHPPPPHSMNSSYPPGPCDNHMEYDRDHRGGGYQMRNRREEGMREPTNTVWVGNLSPQHTEENLRHIFSEFGRVMRIAKDPAKSYCFVHFRFVEEARNAVEAISSRGSLGPVNLNYGKKFEYPQEELDAPHESVNHKPLRKGRDDDRHDNNDDRRRRPRREEGYGEPSNVLWIGDLPHTISDDELKENFHVFGTIKGITRLEGKNMAFIQFETIESCTQALDLMRNQSIGGARVSLNYGRQQRNPVPTEVTLTPDGIPMNENPTNVVYLGNFASDVTEEDIEDLFDPFEGFINSKFIQANGIAFGHFDTVDHARAVRVALTNTLLKGAPMRVSFGKNNHKFTMADRMRRGRPAPLGGEIINNLNLGNESTNNPMGNTLDGINGSLVTGPTSSTIPEGNALISLPAMGVVVGTTTSLTQQVPTYLTRERPAPEMNLDARLQSLLGSTYNNIGESEKPLTPTIIQTICGLIDECVDEKSEKKLDDTISIYTPVYSAHIFGIMAKRMHEYFKDDPHKKLLILYAGTRVLLGVKSNYSFFSKASLNAYLMTLLVTSQGQTSSGMELVTSIIENIRKHSFIENQKLDTEYIEVFRLQLDEIIQRAKVDQDLASLLTKKRRR